MNRLFPLTLSVILAILTTWASISAPRAFISAQESDVGSVKGERRALLVAVSRYAEGFTELPSTDNDVELLKSELVNSGFKEVNIRVLRHSGKLPTRDNIAKAVQNLANSCGPEDLALIMLTGHGLRNDETKEDFFLPLDAKSGDFNTFVPLNWVIDSLEASQAKFKWLIVDACRNNGKNTVDGTSMGKLEPKSGMLIFQSSAPGEISWFTDDNQYGLFIYNFVEGLRGKAIGDDGRVSVMGAFTYAQNQIGEKQHPVMSSKDFTDFVLTENDEWTLGANFYRKALESIDAGDFFQAQKNIDLAIALKTPLESVYCKKAETIKVLVNASKKTDENIEETIEPKSSNVSSSNQPKPTSASTSNQSKPSSVPASSQSKPTNDSTSAKVDWETGKAGDRRVIIVDGIEFAFRYCPAGRHTIGSPESEEMRGVYETRHDIIFSHPYWMMETEVTQEMWEKVMGSNPSRFKGSNLPVESVSWDDCQDFIQKLNEKGLVPSGWVFSLPTEAEWEVAARAGSTTAFPWGNTLNGDKANCDGNHPYGTDTKGKFLNKTCAVKSYSPNAWGLYDTAGNVYEWCLDKCENGAYPETVETDYVGKEGLLRALRGGGCFDDAQFCRSSRRLNNDASLRYYNRGFRCALAFALVRQQQAETSIQPQSSDTSSDNQPNLSSDSASNQSKPSSSSNESESDWETGKAGDRRVIMVDGIEFAFRYCPAGRHTIGSPENEAERFVKEMQHDVIFSHPYWMMETEVTQEMWEKVMGKNPSRFKGSDLPVEFVSWNDCQEFIKKLNAKGLAPSGWVISLPTEAEWEVAARAGSTTAFPWGNTLNGDKANCDGNHPYGTDTKGKFLNKTCAVKSYSPNAWGLYDMSGNVCEWCLDKHGDYPETVETDYVGKEDSSRVNRGGSWANYALGCRSSCRGYSDPSSSYGNVGFRCSLARVLVRQQQEQ